MHPEFPQDPDLVYLNHAGVGPWPKRTRDAVIRFSDENIHRGAADYPRWLETENALRERLARLIGAHAPHDIALVKNTSEGLSVIAHGLDWQAGDEVIINTEEFPSNRIVWESLHPRGVRIRDVDTRGADDPEQRLIAAMGSRTRLLSVSSVQYGSGRRMDLARLASACREHQILLCVDAIQSLGALQFDLASVAADFVVADGHKWMLAPEGLGLLYVRPELRERLTLHQFGWHMVEHAGDYDRKDWQPAQTARRFECGSPNMLATHALEASLSLLQDEVGMAAVESRVLANTGHLCDRLRQEPALELLSDPSPARRSGIVVFRSPGLDSAVLHRQLMQAGVICARRGGGVRFAPHFYNTPEQLDRALDTALAALP
ncbi:aminotransferase class V-fold PLP-dependent enzyme [Methylonatrum kenyense]|uniref:aminotransferase class V-fold PLP-dependent enzyme n=1 Tax=Methylonatrum kenyense TaxID=455253 RepID=UPI0020BE5430|nr:aminotransferase class V-fold PLP-dependent enzyme [Methylonatrum kenyense]MCK8516504.1 aminotransferase class V-fold PLP-dependent enzyme [Methylonatrum kenyense]